MVVPDAFGLTADEQAWRGCANRMAWPQCFIGHSALACLFATLLLSGCYHPSVLPQSEGHLTTPATNPALDNSVPPPARTSTFVPAPKPTIKPPTYSVVVSEVPVKELLFALARDSKQNIDINPGLQGLVSLNAINETLPAILERISKQVNMRYRMEGNTMVVSPDTAYVKTYRINYVNMTRETTSSIGVSGQIQGAAGASSGTGATGTATTGGGQTNASNTTVKTVSNNNFWDTLRDNIRAILNSTRQQTLSADAKAERAELVRQQQDFQIKQLEAASRAGAGASGLATSVITSNTNAQQSTLLPDDVIVNSLAGTVTINATEKQHQLVQQYLDTITQSSQRQVLIEATIAEVTLSDAYQAGIDWSRLAVSGGISVTQSLIGSVANAFTPGSLTVGYANTNSRIGNIAATVKLLNQFGNTRVLSSPKLMALNNQTAILKVVDNLVYFTIEANTATTQGAISQTFNTTAQTVPIGVVMSLTPQINENGQVTITVRPTITRILSFINDPNPSLCDATHLRCISNPVPQIQTREMESVLQLVSGQTAMLGGLMQDDVQRDRNAVPGIGNVPQVGEVFSMRNDVVSKSELVIFLRSTVITNPSLESDELKFYQRFLPQQTETPTETYPGEKAGVAQ